VQCCALARPWHADVAVLRFADTAARQGGLSSDAYQALTPLREGAAERVLTACETSRQSPALALQRNRRMRTAPVSTTAAISRPMIQSGHGVPSQATSAPAPITPRFAITSLAEKM
jgi:hypothetical protein